MFIVDYRKVFDQCSRIISTIERVLVINALRIVIVAGKSLMIVITITIGLQRSAIIIFGSLNYYFASVKGYLIVKRMTEDFLLIMVLQLL